MEEDNWEEDTTTNTQDKPTSAGSTDNNNNQVSKEGWQPRRPTSLNTKTNNNDDSTKQDNQEIKTRSFTFRPRNNDGDGNKNDDSRGSFSRNRDSDSRRGGFGNNRGGYSRNGDNQDGRRRGGFGNRDRDGDNQDGGRSGSFGNRNRDGDNQDGDNQDGGRRGGFGNRNQDGDNQDGGRRGGFGNRNRDGDNQDGGRRGGFSNRNRDGDNQDGGRRGGFGNRNRDGDNQDGDNQDGGRKGGFGNKFNRNQSEPRSNGFKNKDSTDGERKFGSDRRDDNNNERPRRSYSSRRDQNDENSENKEGKFGDRRKSTANGDGEQPKREDYRPEELPDTDLFHEAKIGAHFDKLQSIQCKLTGQNCEEIKPIESFNDAPLSDLLQENISKSNYTVPTPVQRYSIPAILNHRDLMACAQTGSGKTAAFVIPIITNILQDGIQSAEFSEIQVPQALVLSPTRELAIQTYNECRKFGYGSVIKTQILYGGTNTGYQLKNLARGTNILVATPGRLMDVINKGKVSLEKVKYIVLDEADRMLDSGFEKEVRVILEKCTLSAEERQILMFSATFPDEIQRLAQDFLKNYLFLTVGVVGGANSDVEQAFFEVTRFKKREKLIEMLNDIGDERVMVFMNSKRQSDVLGFFLIDKGFPTTTIHGDRLQKQREEALNDFKIGKCKVIICTSVAARGLDINDVKYVINFDLPNSIDEYVHRIGRTGRCGNVGKAISFFDPENSEDCRLARPLVRILMDAQQKVPEWLSEVAENAIGQSADTHRVTNDLRSNFQTKMNLDDQPSATQAAPQDEEAW